MSEQRIAIAGCTGRMGRMLIEATLKGDGVRLVAAFDQPGNPFVGRDAGELLGAACGWRSVTAPLRRSPRPTA